MKKLLSLSLLLMLVVMCFALASCSGVSTDDVEENPLQVYMQAAQNTPTLFFADDNGIVEAMNEALMDGAVSIDFSNKDILSMLDSKLSSLGATIYINREDGEYGADANINYGGKNYGVSGYISPELIGVTDKGMLGVNNSYYVDIEDILENLPSTSLGKDLGVSAQMYSQIKPMIEEYRTYLNDMLANLEIPEDNYVNTLLKSLGQTVTEEEIKIGGEEIDCVVVKYTISNATIKNAFKALMKSQAASPLFAFSGSNLTDEEIDEMFEEMNEICDINITLKIYLNADENTFAKVDLSGKVAYEALYDIEEIYDEYYESGADEYQDWDTYYYNATNGNPDATKTVEIPMSLVLTVSETDVALTGSATVEGVKYGGAISLKKTTTDDNIKYTLKASATMGPVTADLLTVTMTHNQDNGAFNITATVDGTYLGSMSDNDMASLLLDKDGNLTATLSGTATDDDGATITISKASVGTLSIDIGVKFVFMPGEIADEIDDGVDISTLTEDKAENIFDKIEDSFIVEFFDNIF